MTCIFSEPLQTGTGGELITPISENANFQFSKLVCDNPTTTEKIVNLDYPMREFFVDKTFSYGDALIIFFLTLFFIFTISKEVFNFFWKK